MCRICVHPSSSSIPTCRASSTTASYSVDARTLHRSGSAWRVDTEEGPVDAKDAVIALGPWAPDVLTPLGIKLPLAWKRGYHRHFRPVGNAALTRPVVDTDNGWLAVYFDTLSRVNATQQAYLTTSPRLHRLYEAFREPDPKAFPARAVFRKAPALLMLFTRLQWDTDGQPRIPGNLEVWKQVLAEKSEPKIVKDWGRRARGFKRPEQLLEAMAAMSRIDTDLGPLQLYLMLNEVDSRRPWEKRLAPDTVLVLATKFSQLSNWYLVFSEFPDLDDTSIKSFVKVADAVAFPDEDLNREALVHLVVVAAADPEGGELTKAALAEACRSRLAPWKVPGRISFVQEIPRTGIGKPRIAVLREQLNASAGS